MSSREALIFRLGLKVSGLLTPLVNRTNGKLVSGGVPRSYLLHVPESYNPAVPAPLVISLHGFAEWPAHQMQVSHWNDLADRYGFLVVYPCGSEVPLRWHVFGRSGSDPDLMRDVAFISDLIDRLARDYNLDPARIFVNGLSNGGGMAFVLSGKLSERIAAFGSVAGAYTFPWSEYQPARAVPAIIFHGTQDPLVPYSGGASMHSGFPFPSIPEWVATLARKNGCVEDPRPLPPAGKVEGLRFANCTSKASILFYTVHEGGHSWPGGGSLPRIIAGRTNRDIDATRTMWDFFQQHPLKVQ
jgi:polyhydroxybutyrate depolymerase